jgi:hypoxanthine phosphoribosyltransferase
VVSVFFTLIQKKLRALRATLAVSSAVRLFFAVKEVFSTFATLMSVVTLHGKDFVPYISAEVIHQNVSRIAEGLTAEIKKSFPLFVVVLNGSFIFAADLVKLLKFPCEISFVKLSSYSGTSSTGDVIELIGLTENIENRTVIIVEDIVDTGNTLEKLHALLKGRKAKDIKTVTLLFKPEAYTKTIKLDYVGIEIQNDFVVGYGLDYDGLGRNLKDIYILRP